MTTTTRMLPIHQSTIPTTAVRNRTLMVLPVLVLLPKYLLR